jgi:hypothetical protein
MRATSYAAATLLAVLACRTVGDPPPPPVVPTAPSAPAAAPSPPAPAREAVSFDASVKPLLARTCTPCHVPGGRMYERMPFDRPETILAHKEGILRRMKAPDDRQRLERWLETQPN